MQLTDHALVAILGAVAYWLLRYRQLPDSRLVGICLFAGLFPDLVDKPLSWGLGVLPSGRMLAHSFVIGALVVGAVALVGYRLGARRSYGVAFAWGYLSHLVGDFYPVIRLGTDYYYFPNMLWPILEANPDRNPGLASNAPELGFQTMAKATLLVLLLVYIVLDLWVKPDTEPTHYRR